MSNLDTIVEISKIARAVASSLLYRRFVSNIAIVMLLSVITGILAGILLLGGLYAVYLMLARHGLDADMAMLVTYGIAVVVTVICAALTCRFIRKLRDALFPLPATSYVRRMAESFMDGFTEPPHS